MLIMFLMHRCLWIQEKRCLLAVFLAHLKLVIYIDEVEIFYVTLFLNGFFQWNLQWLWIVFTVVFAMLESILIRNLNIQLVLSINLVRLTLFIINWQLQKGAGRVAFSNQQSYIAAISARFVQLQHADIEKRVCQSM